jgi:hypothetical protein
VDGILRSHRLGNLKSLIALIKAGMQHEERDTEQERNIAAVSSQQREGTGLYPAIPPVVFYCSM